MLWIPAGSLEFSPILKIPLLFASNALVHAAYTPPNPPPDESEAARYGAKPDTLSRTSFTTIAAGFVKLVHWSLASFESIVILANEYPTPALSTALSHLIIPGHTAAGIRFTPEWTIGCICMCTGALLRLASYRELGRFFTWELSVKKDHRLVTTGPYSVVRHPAYLGNLLISTGTLLFHLGPGSWFKEGGWFSTDSGKVMGIAWLVWLIWVPFMLCSRVVKEDQILKETFPEEWERWAAKTPYRLIPFIY